MRSLLSFPGTSTTAAIHYKDRDVWRRYGSTTGQFPPSLPIGDCLGRATSRSEPRPSNVPDGSGRNFLLAAIVEKLFSVACNVLARGKNLPDYVPRLFLSRENL